MACAPKCRTLWGFADVRGVRRTDCDIRQARGRADQPRCGDVSRALRPGDRGVLVLLLPRAAHRRRRSRGAADASSVGSEPLNGVVRPAGCFRGSPFRPCHAPRPQAPGSARSCASRPVPPCHPCSLSAAAAPCSSMRTHGAICALHELFHEPSLLSLCARSPRDAGPATLLATCDAVLWSIPLAAGADKGWIAGCAVRLL